MKRNYTNVAFLCMILLANIVFTQLLVHQYYFQNYGTVLVYCGVNLLLFPIALYVYKQDKKRRGEKEHEQ